MKYKLINEPNSNYSAKEQILINRGIPQEELYHYMNLTKEDLSFPTDFMPAEGLDIIASCYLNHIENEDEICFIVDCDADGYMSSSLAINFTYDLTSEDYVNEKIHWFMHSGKQHGIADAMDWITEKKPKLLIIPDAGSNDIVFLKQLEDNGVDVIVLDHHIVEEKVNEEMDISPLDFWRAVEHPHLFLLNSQLSPYPNKFLCGAGVTYQFCRYIDSKLNTEYSDRYLDLVSVGLTSDMMSLKSYETRYLITEGLKPSNIYNPFILGMWAKNKFKLGCELTSWGVTFYITPLINAITRSGTLEEKNIVFESMLTFKAFEKVPSTKRGHKIGETEKIVDQAIRICTNVKNRQTKAEKQGIDFVEHLIQENNMMEHKVLLFLLDSEKELKPQLRGLVGNKIMAKYQRPCCVLTKTVNEDGEIIYQGSARGYEKGGIENFKEICANSNVTEYTAGHENAFGLGISEKNISTFIENTDSLLKDMESEPTYKVDYIWSPDSEDAPEKILEIGKMDKYWGKDIEVSLVVIKNIIVTKENLFMMASNTMKIILPNGVSLIKFRTPEEEYDELYSESGQVIIDVVGECNINEWAGTSYPQIFIKDYNIINKQAYIF